MTTDNRLQPLTVENVETFAWDDVADVVVVGFGGAGVTAALEAAENGADVIAVDRFEGGGSTWWSGGVIYAGGTRYQKEAGIDDNEEEMFKYLSIEYGDRVKPETLRKYCSESAPTVDWLAKNGVPFGSTFYKNKTIYPPDGYYLYYSGNEKIAGYRERARPAARGHRPVASGSSGKILYEALSHKAKQAQNIRLLTHSPVTRLVVDQAGTVVGVEINALPQALHAKHSELNSKIGPLKPFNNFVAEQAIKDCRALEASSPTRRLVRAKFGVILSTGGFVYNLDMFREHRQQVAQHFETIIRLSTMGDDGSGITLGKSVGGATAHMDQLNIGMSIAPPDTLLAGVLVNNSGERFINEDAYVSFVGNAVVAQPEGQGWLILDRAAFWASFNIAAKQALGLQGPMARYFGLATLGNMVLGGTKRAGSLKRLAKKCGITADRLLKTIDDYNKAVVSPAGDPLHKSPDYARPIGRGGYYALNLSLRNKYVFTQVFTLGGLVPDDETGAVISLDGRPIKGLYAAGRTTAGINATRNLSGMSIGDCVFSGRRAARSCIKAKQFNNSNAAPLPQMGIGND